MTTEYKRLAGFTLLELLVVISIISVLATLGMFVLPKALVTAKITKTRTEISNLQVALIQYKSHHGIFPDDSSAETVINALTGYRNSPDAPDPAITGGIDWRGPYLETKPNQHVEAKKNKALLDAWRQPYQFKLRKPAHNIGGIDIWSFGPDMKDDQGNGDDISNWK